MNNSEQITKLSQEVLRFSRNSILVKLRFLDVAFSRLKPVESAEISFGTDGKHLVYIPMFLLKRYSQDSNYIVRDLLHTVLHCIFRHSFVDPRINRKLWDLSCDIVVESVINSFYLKSAEISDKFAQERETSHLETAIGMLMAEKLYRYFCDNRPTQAQIETLTKLFHRDDHRLWYMNDDEKLSAGVGKTDASDDGDNTNYSPETGSEEDWKNIAERIEIDMETLSHNQGICAGCLLQGLKAINRERCDYTAFLKKFAVMGEAMEVNDDEFDYVFYTYGLKLYKNMPLIEPLEYKEVKRIREFVIAIDTSGSVLGETVQKFIQKTYNVLKSQDTFFTKVNIHIIQCDADIQEHIKITSQEEFDEYLKNMQLKGFGGTDFRPVFYAVDVLLAKKEFTNLKGLIYFTDGYGTFPCQKPPYETAFVFIDDGYKNPEVPPWAIKLILQEDEI